MPASAVFVDRQQALQKYRSALRTLLHDGLQHHQTVAEDDAFSVMLLYDLLKGFKDSIISTA